MLRRQGVDYVGVTCVFYCHDGKGNLLLHQRTDKCRDEQGRWDCGGGEMKVGETFEQTVKREIKEEYCVNAQKLKLVGVNNLLRTADGIKTHWVAIIFAVKVNPKKVRIGDYKKIAQYGWFKQNKLPSPLHSMYLIHLQFVKNAGII